MKYLITLFVLLAIVVASPMLTPKSYASGVFDGSCTSKPNEPGYNAKLQDTDVCKDIKSQQNDTTNANPIVSIIRTAVNIISFVVGVAAIIGILASCIRLITASGDAASISSARSGIVYSLIGIAVVILAQSIVVLVLSRLS